MLTAAFLIVAIYSIINLLPDTFLASTSEKSSVLRQSMKNQTQTFPSTHHLTSTKNPQGKYLSLVSNSGDSHGLAKILASFRFKIGIHARRIVNPHRFEYVQNVPEACRSKAVEILIGVPSRVDSFAKRDAIREAWGSFGSDVNNKAVVLYFLGSTHNKVIQEKVNSEAKEHGDIIQEAFIDSYKNLSLKTIALVKWASLNCQDSTFVVKADDDMYINVPNLLTKLRMQLDRGPLFIMGSIIQDAKPFRIKGHKWYTKFSEYPHHRYPNFVSGTAYAMTTTAAMRLYVESFFVHPLYLEDIYLTGILADKASVPRVSAPEFSGGKFNASGCNFKHRISGHRNSPDEIRKIYKELSNPNLKC